MKIFITLFILAFQLFSSKLRGEDSYTLADLEVLEKNGNYLEFFEHARDLRPSLRNEYWKNMLSSMAESMVDQKLKLKDFKLTSFDYVESIAQWPELVKAEFFHQKRAAYASDFLSSCLEKQERPLCSERILNYWKTAQKRPEQGLFFYKELEKTLSQDEAFNFIITSTKHDFAKFYCKNPLVIEASLQRILEQFSIEEEDKTRIEQISKYFNNDCIKELLPSLRVQLTQGDQVSSEIFFRFLSVKNLLTENERDLYLTHFLLQGPFVGSTFNSAWNVLESLGANSSRRAAVMKNLMTLDFLPGKLFMLQDEARRTAVVKLFVKNMPEYLDHYARTCMSYYRGSSIFPKGNPTMECQALVSLQAQVRIFPSALLSELQTALKR
jgi:hypothetical protein